MVAHESPGAVPEGSWLKEQWVELDGLEQGRWRVEWWDPHAGEVTGEGEITVEGSTTKIDLPAFPQDLAAKLVKIQD
jgi:phenolic acid decarboxylase